VGRFFAPGGGGCLWLHEQKGEGAPQRGAML
jgi:hypothetical protein